MAFSKAHLYDPNLQIISEKMKAFAYPARLQILFYLHQHGPCPVHQIAADHPISPEALSGHLAILRKAKLLSCEERFPYTYYKVNRIHMRKIIQLLIQWLSGLD
jgi:DNA-binding transcriptional ArsR family regulator